MNAKSVASCLLLLVVTLLTNEAHGQLQCYVCENCPDPFDSSAHSRQRCPPDAATTTTLAPGQTTTIILTPPPLPGVDTTTIVPPTPPIVPNPPVVGRRRRQVDSNADSYRCYRIEHLGIVRRGCAAFINNAQDTCQSVNGGVIPTDCHVCDWDGCNGSAAGLRVSVMAVLLAALLTTLLRD
ncbi:uncharacterized protein LOC128271132 [Anopheles cruzii]|uniref:uncharacterized protein LOC128271132 n=1 Tax=Anopheles cruzii TaxID=68878 RepID=UPI0022EC6A72|nr:uncharacterized protein LOC128271132 [Anopheles cruzii]